jgi:hypothetical protein
LLQLLGNHARHSAQLGDVGEWLTLPARDDCIGYLVADAEHSGEFLGELLMSTRVRFSRK